MTENGKFLTLRLLYLGVFLSYLSIAKHRFQESGGGVGGIVQ